MSLLLGLAHGEQLPPVVRDELEQLIAAIQVGFSNIAGAWVDIPYASTNFRTGTSMVWTVEAADQITFRYLLIGRTLTISFALNLTSVSGTPNMHLDLALPNGLSSSRRQFGVFYYIDNGTQGIGFTRIVEPGAASLGDPSVLQLWRTDTANWTASTNNTSVRGTVTLEVAG